MAGGEDDAISLFESLEEVLDAIQFTQILDILGSRMPQPCHLGQHQSEVVGGVLEECVALALIETGKRDLEMRTDAFSASRQQPESGLPKGPADRPGNGQRESSADGNKGPETGIESETPCARRHGASVTLPAAVWTFPPARSDVQKGKREKEKKRKGEKEKRGRWVAPLPLCSFAPLFFRVGIDECETLKRSNAHPCQASMRVMVAETSSISTVSPVDLPIIRSASSDPLAKIRRSRSASHAPRIVIGSSASPSSPSR